MFTPPADDECFRGDDNVEVWVTKECAHLHSVYAYIFGGKHLWLHATDTAPARTLHYEEIDVDSIGDLDFRVLGLRRDLAECDCPVPDSI